ncbi:chloride channel protein [[Clostridium] colinum]|uniref:chloride channel protein n=1 Tax=[Clostridium] colinum TaxID=36835 RepID=UPI0020252E3F|nr:chloride channel protein [[Clostridium] colinum]
MNNIKNYKNLIFLSLIGIPIGVVVGILDTIFGKVLLKITDIRQQFPLFLIPFLALSGVIIVYCYNKFGGKASKGMSLIFEVAQNKEEKIPLRLIPFIILSTWLTHLFGGSAGREGVAVQIGATFSNWVSQKINIQNANKIFLITGMSAGFAGLFQTPIAAIFFAIEVLIAGAIHYGAILPAITASFTASTVSHLLGLEKFTFYLSSNINLDFTTILKLIILGIIFGLVGGSFAVCLKYIKSFFTNKINNPIKRIFVISIILSIIFLILHKGRYSGLGTNLINASFYNEQIYYYDWILKFILTIFTLSIGFQGGEVTPLFSIGASLGVILATMFNLPIEFVAGLGYLSVFGSATNTFLAPIFIGGEVFGYEYMPFYFIIMVFAYTFNFNKSIYSLQQSNNL